MLNAFKDKDLKEGVFFEPVNFQMTNYIDKWKNNVLNFDGQLMKFGEINNLNSEQEKKWFIRPNNDGKEFSGRVEAFKDLVIWSKKVCQLELPELNRNTEVWISEPKEIKNKR